MPLSVAQPNGLDRDGFLEVVVALDKVPLPFRPVLDESVARLTATFTERLEGVYLYGSVATGEARLGRSDLDLLVLFKEPFSGAEEAELKALAATLSASNRRVVREVGMGGAAVLEALSPEGLPGLGCFLKHLCVCAAGHDMRPDLPRFGPTTAVARGFNGDYATVTEALLCELAAADRPGEREAMQAVMRRLCRKTIRTGFSLVMPRLGCWTTALDRSVQCFCECYPGQQASMNHMRAWVDEPPAETAEFLRTLTPFAAWLVEEFDLRIGRDVAT